MDLSGNQQQLLRQWLSPGSLQAGGKSLEWRHNERYGVSNHRCLDRLLSRVLGRR